MKKEKILGMLMIIPTILLLVWIIIFSVWVTLFGAGSGISIMAMTPFIIISVLQLLILTFSFYFSLKLLKQQPLPIKENNTIANVLIVIGALYFIYNLVSVIYNNFSGFNPGGWAQPVLAFLWGLIMVSFGMALKKSNE